MAPDSQLDDLSRIVDLLVDSADDRTRDRVLVEALESMGWAQSVALYRRVPERSDVPNSGWFEVLARGPADLLPSAGEIEAIESGELMRELPLGRHAFISGRGGDATALALGGVSCDEDDLDLIEALFEVLVAVRGGSEEPAPSLLGLIEAPLPSSGDEPANSPELHELRNLLTSINTVQCMLAGELGELDDDESERYEDIFDVECERAADLVGEVLSGTRGLVDDGTCCPSAELSAWARREHARLKAGGVELEMLAALALEEVEVEMTALDFRRGLALLVDNALVALRARAPEFSGRLQVLWAPHGHGGALLVVEDDGRAMADERLDLLTHELEELGWCIDPAQRTTKGLRIQARFSRS